MPPRHTVRLLHALTLLGILISPGCTTPPRPSTTLTQATDLLITRGPVILHPPGMPPLIFRTPLDAPPPPLPPDVLADPDYTTITLPTGTIVTFDQASKTLFFAFEPAHANDNLEIVSNRNSVYGIDTVTKHYPATHPAQH